MRTSCRLPLWCLSRLLYYLVKTLNLIKRSKGKKTDLRWAKQADSGKTNLWVYTADNISNTDKSFSENRTLSIQQNILTISTASWLARAGIMPLVARCNRCEARAHTQNMNRQSKIGNLPAAVMCAALGDVGKTDVMRSFFCEAAFMGYSILYSHCCGWCGEGNGMWRYNLRVNH